MPWVSRRAQAEQAAVMDRLRERCERAEQDIRVQSGANGLLAARTGDTEAQLREALRLMTADRDGLLVQLDRALGYDDWTLAEIAAGATVKGGTAA